MAESYGEYFVIMRRHWDTSLDEYTRTGAGYPVAVLDTDPELAKVRRREHTLRFLSACEIDLQQYLQEKLTPAARRRLFSKHDWAGKYIRDEEWEEAGLPIPLGAPARFYEAVADVIGDLFYFIDKLPIPPPRI